MKRQLCSIRFSNCINWLGSLTLLLLTACSNHELKKDASQRVQEWSMNEPSIPISELTELVIKKGDTSAYQELDIAYMDTRHGEFYKIAKLMADTYDFPQAYYDVYIQLLKPTANPETTINLDSCSKEERSEAIKYLKKAFEKGFTPAGLELIELKEHGYIK